MEEGPWIFRDVGQCVEKYDRILQHEGVKLDQIYAWVWIHKLPELMRKKEIIWDLASRIGEVEMVELTSWSIEVDYVRASVKLNVYAPLARSATLTPEGRSPMFLKLAYEKVHKFCKVCGLLGHKFDECGNGVHEPKDFQYGDWMLADTTSKG
jgi:hypothetical protein